MLDAKTFSKLALLGAILSMSQAFAAGGGGDYEEARIDPNSIPSLQRGARNFMNYCAGCHSAKYVRYSTIGKHLGLSDEQLIDNLMFNAEKTFETINVSMTAADGERWFGIAPPDMSLIARAKGADYIYSFLKGFYVEEGGPTGVNNLYLAGTAMPHVLWELEGHKKANFSEETADGVTTYTFENFEQLTPGTLSAEEYDSFVRDTVNFLVYIAEPIRSDRRKLGVWTLIFLTVFLILAYMLKKEIWKDVK